MSLHAKITLGTAAAMLCAFLVTLALYVRLLDDTVRSAFEHELLNIARITAQSPEIIAGLRDSPFSGAVQYRVQKIIDASPDVDQITVCDMQRIRYAHDNPAFIGIIEEGDDIREVLYQAKSYVTPGESGAAATGFIRAYAPVFDGGEQVGFVIAGVDDARLRNASGHLALSALVFAVAGMSVGTVGAVLLGQQARRDLLGLEPREITQIYREHVGLVEAMHEGVIAINNRGRISLINQSARRLLELGDAQIQGQAIDRVMPNPRLPRVIATGEAEFDYEKRINNRVFIASMVPIFEGDRVVGAVETFQDRTQLIRMAEELTGIKQLVEALRASSHEFSNKLHVILGLVELGEYDRAKSYIQDTQREHGKLHTEMLRVFREPMIAGLMLGKYSVAREQGVELAVAPGSGLERLESPSLAHALVLILGNLIDNALDSVRGNPARDGRISVDIGERNGTIKLSVEDNGRGVAPEHCQAIFRRGFSTKGEGRGTGLYLVRQELDLLGGDIEVHSEGGRTLFTAVLPTTGID